MINMRLSILAFCFLILAACAILIYESSLRSDSTQLSFVQNPEPSTDVLAPKNEPLFTVSAPKVASIATTLPLSTPSVPDWEIRFLEITSEPVWMQSQDELEELAKTLTDDQMRGALDKLSVEQSDAGIILGKLLVLRWAEKSPAEASQWLEHLPDNVFSRVAFKEVVVPWAEKDLVGAVGWVQQLPEGGNKTAAELSLASEAATRKEGVTAIILVANLPPSSERNDLLNYSARQWATVDQKNAVAWINQVQDPMLREDMLVNVAVDLAVQNPFDAATFAATALTPGKGKNKAVVDIVRFMAVSAPDRAAAWVAQFPDGNLRIAAMENLVDVWGQDDPGAAGAWVNAISQSE